jgi:hypothetical protein
MNEKKNRLSLFQKFHSFKLFSISYCTTSNKCYWRNEWRMVQKLRFKIYASFNSSKFKFSEYNIARSSIF